MPKCVRFDVCERLLECIGTSHSCVAYSKILQGKKRLSSLTCKLVQEFAGKVGSLRKALKSRAELIFIDAPHRVEAEQSASDAAPDARAWWSWQVCC